MPFVVHVCLVSEQVLPNLLPALDPETRPDEAVLLVSPDMRNRGETLGNLLRDAGCRARLVDVAPYSFPSIRQTVAGLMDGMGDCEAVLNVTGGTKIMALGAYEVFRDRGHSVFYIDTHDGERVELFPEVVRHPLPELLKVETALKAYGYAVAEKGEVRVRPEVRALTELLVSEAEGLESALSMLNACSGSAEKQLYCEVREPALSNGNFLRLVGVFSEAGFLSFDGRHLVFPSQDSRFFANGGWLEQHVLGVVDDLRRDGRILDRGCALKVSSSGGSANELDVAFTAHNRLHLVECKTQRFGRNPPVGESPGGKATEVIYKLDSVNDLIGGTFGRAMLASFCRLPEGEFRRCQEHGINVVQGSQLKAENLRSLLVQWIG